MGGFQVSDSRGFEGAVSMVCTNDDVGTCRRDCCDSRLMEIPTSHELRSPPQQAMSSRCPTASDTPTSILAPAMSLQA